MAAGVSRGSSSSHVIGIQPVSLNPDLGFQLTLQKVEKAAQQAEQASDISNPIDSQRVKVLASTLWQQIQSQPNLPNSDAALNQEIDTWMDPVKVIEVGNPLLNVMVLFNAKGRLGKGGESIVYKGILAPQGEVCAVKHIDPPKDDDVIAALDQKLADICNDHYVVHYYGYQDQFVIDPLTKKYLQDAQGNFVVNQYLVEELCAGSLFDLCDRAERIPSSAEAAHLNSHLFNYIGQILQGVADMHGRDVIHGDIKLDNILLSQSRDEIRISDLNGVVSVNEEPRAGTLNCAAPEQVDHNKAFFLENKNLPHPDSKQREVWQTMLVIAEMSEGRLSPEFQARIWSYLNTCRQYEEEAIDEATADPRSININMRNYLKATFYTAKAVGYLAGMRARGEEGLFSDLNPTSDLERLLVSMSTFDPGKRISAQQALAMFRQP